MNNAVWDTILSQPGWKSVPPEWLAQETINPAKATAEGKQVLLFRTHKFHDPQTGVDDTAILHAAPRPIIGTAMNRLNAQRIYLGSAQPFNFITVYEANQTQKFYRDETLEHVHKGEQADDGETLSCISIFDKARHFETNAHNNKSLGTYIVLLPPQKISGMVDKEQVRILPVTPEIAQMLQAIVKPKQRITSQP